MRSLRLQVIWAPLVVLAFAAALLGLQVRSRQRTAARYEALTRMRERLDHHVLRLTDRHMRSARTAREALLDPDAANQVRVLLGQSELYQRELERLLSAASSETAKLEVPDAHPRLEADLMRLQDNYDLLRSHAAAFAPTLKMLQEAISAEEPDPEVIYGAELEFDHADSEMQAALNTTARIVRVAATMQANHAATMPVAPVPLAAWIVLALATPLAVWLAYRPLSRIHSLAHGRGSKPRSHEEELLAGTIAELTSARDTLDKELGERIREAERAAQSCRRAERELALLRLYNENLVNSLRSAIVVTDAGGQITGLNRAARRLLDMRGDDVGTPVEEHALFEALDKRTDAAADLARALAYHEPLRFEGVPYPSRGGEILLDLAIAPYLDESGAARGLLWVSDDVTEEVRTKKQLLAAERLAAVGSLSAQVAHEIRNPLSAIGLNAELLDEEFASGLSEPRRAEAATLLSAIASEIERLTQVTEGYLRLARMPRPEFGDTDLNVVITDLLNMLGEELKAHRITPHLDLATPPPRAHADPGQLRQALLNVVRNSREAMPNGGELRVATRRNTQTCVIEVGDTGVGIQADQVGRVFEPFYTTKPHGTGLGLSLTHQIVAEHGGTVEVLASHDGTTIRIVLPDAC